MKVVYCKREKYDVYIGRPSIFGNPYSHKEDTLARFKTKTRKEAIQKYKEYILMPENKDLLGEIYKLKGKTLGCWCGNFTIKDKDKLYCHGQILLELLYAHPLF
jgi:hypothetical protein